MKRPTLVLLAMAVVLAAGFTLSIYSTQSLFESLTMLQGSVEPGIPMEISAEIPPGTGIFAFEVVDHDPNMSMHARVLGPFGSVIDSVETRESAYESTFKVDEIYEYVMILESGYAESVDVVAVIGPEPDSSQNAMGFVSLYMLLVGVAGMIAATIYVIVTRMRQRSGPRF